MAVTYAKNIRVFVTALSNAEKQGGALTKPTLADLISSGIEISRNDDNDNGSNLTSWDETDERGQSSRNYVGKDQAVIKTGTITKGFSLNMDYDHTNAFHLDLEKLSGVNGITLTHLTDEGACKAVIYYDKNDASGSRVMQVSKATFGAAPKSFPAGDDPATITTTATLEFQTRYTDGA